MSRWWVMQAACDASTLGLWFSPSYPESRVQALWRQRRAKQICDVCPVWKECLAEELMVPLAAQFGVRAGMTVAQRRCLLARWRRAGMIPQTAPPDDAGRVRALLAAEHESESTVDGA